MLSGAPGETSGRSLMEFALILLAVLPAAWLIFTA